MDRLNLSMLSEEVRRSTAWAQYFEWKSVVFIRFYSVLRQRNCGTTQLCQHSAYRLEKSDRIDGLACLTTASRHRPNHGHFALDRHARYRQLPVVGRSPVGDARKAVHHAIDAAHAGTERVLPAAYTRPVYPALARGSHGGPSQPAGGRLPAARHS